MQIKTTWTFHLSPIRMVSRKKKRMVSSYFKDCGTVWIRNQFFNWIFVTINARGENYSDTTIGKILWYIDGKVIFEVFTLVELRTREKY